MTHIDEWICAPGSDGYASAMFTIFRLPALEMLAVRKHILGDKKLFCMYDGKRYRVTGASRMGDVWLAKDPRREDGYDLRVDVDDCSDWGGQP